MESTSKKLIWLDCDPGHDDAMAIFLAFFHQKSQLIALSAVHGNQTVEKTSVNIQRLLKLAQIENQIPIFKGESEPLTRKSLVCPQIHGQSGIEGAELPQLQKDEAISDPTYSQWLEVFQAQKQKVNLVATGSLTNVANLLTKQPEVKEYIEQISLMGGARDFGNMSPAAEFNILVDPEAAKIVFKSGIKLAAVPLEVTHTVLV